MGGPRTRRTTPANPRKPRIAPAGLRKPRTAPAGLRAAIPKTCRGCWTTKEPTRSARPGEKIKSSAPAMEEILGHYEEESRFCGTRSYTMEIPVGDEVEAVEAIGKIFLEEVKVSLSQLYNLLLYNP
jgi:hypothetical protein